MTIDIQKDLSTLTTIDESNIRKLFNKIPWCISEGVEQCLYNNDDWLEVDLGIGNLTIKILDGQIKYKFTPTKEFDKIVIDAVIEERNLLEVNIEKSLKAKISKVYKELL